MNQPNYQEKDKFFTIPVHEEKDFLYNLKSSFNQVIAKLKQFGEELNPAEVDWETETDNAIILLKACLLSVQTF